MAAIQKVKIDVETNLHVKHVVLYIHSSFYETSLKSACTSAEAEGLVLTRSVDVGNYVVLVFIGGKRFLEGADGEEQ